MAITQQLASLPFAHLVACRRSVAELDKLCDGRESSAEYLDLDWWPAPLAHAWEAIGVDHADLSVLRQACRGGEEVNPAYRDAPGTVWEHPVTAVEPSQVRAIATALHTVTPEQIRAVVPTTPDQIEAKLGKAALIDHGDLAAMLSEQHLLLRDFYQRAAARHCATVLWWD